MTDGQARSILFVDDDAAFSRALTRELQRRHFRVVAAPTGGDAIAALATMAPDIVLLDLQLPDMSGLTVLAAVRERQPAANVIMLTGHGTIDTAIEAIKLGAFDYLAKPCPLDELQVRLDRAMERQALQQRASLLERGLTPPDPGGAIVGESPEFRRVMDLVARVAPTDSNVLITGETGTGKEMVAKLIHARSARRRKPFVVVECAALQETLLQSELFGHERGAFTGADRAKPGLFEVADGGTIFLDEIGEVSLATQVKLLRVLDTSTFRRVGSTTEMKVNVRVLAATNRDLTAMVRQGLFREDLYYRLNTIAAVLPPLRERRDDIERLAAHFVASFNERFNSAKRLGPGVVERLTAHDWPGNVRELAHVVEAAMIVCDGDEIRPEHLPAALRAKAPAPVPTANGAAPSGPFQTLEALERSHIERVLAATHGHRGQAAEILGISERNLYRKLREGD
ncbi:MAG: sigma-54-dependent Fis family transcriptional regulator [Acidobacteria bacterium]|nr:MAG: sigma-54-dependent Fis family transcriptional regulator [Acidobacteriota bacterium]